MIHKFQHTMEATLLFISIKLQPFFGIIASVMAIIYYLSMLKVNVVDVKHGGSWKKYLNSIIKRKK